ncbi:hypothetical protein thsrh120_20230 [Rhizobium sp. No.120]
MLPNWLSQKPDEMEEGMPLDEMDGACESSCWPPVSSGSEKGVLSSLPLLCWPRMGVPK